jgi:hypothetical protein
MSNHTFCFLSKNEHHIQAFSSFCLSFQWHSESTEWLTHSLPDTTVILWQPWAWTHTLIPWQVTDKTTLILPMQKSMKSLHKLLTGEISMHEQLCAYVDFFFKQIKGSPVKYIKTTSKHLWQIRLVTHHHDFHIVMLFINHDFHIVVFLS